jgi:hypothetical protein
MSEHVDRWAAHPLPVERPPFSVGDRIRLTATYWVNVSAGELGTVLSVEMDEDANGGGWLWVAWDHWPDCEENAPDFADVELVTASAERATGKDYADATAEMFDVVTRPKHYNSHPSGVEVIRITEHLSFCLGNVVKYSLRAEHKGRQIEDLKKAAWYLAREIDRLERLNDNVSVSSSDGV